MILTLILLFLFFAYASLSGVKDAILYSRLGHLAFRWNEHHLFNAERATIIAIFATGLAIAWYYQPDLLYMAVYSGSITLCGMLTFSFWHNGFYNIARNKIDSINAGFFKDLKGEKTGFINLPPMQRIITFLVGTGAALISARSLL